MHKRRLSASGAALYDGEILLFILHTGGITCKKKHRLKAVLDYLT